MYIIIVYVISSDNGLRIPIDMVRARATEREVGRSVIRCHVNIRLSQRQSFYCRKVIFEYIYTYSNSLPVLNRLRHIKCFGGFRTDRQRVRCRLVLSFALLCRHFAVGLAQNPCNAKIQGHVV